jgi:hypothetical protein
LLRAGEARDNHYALIPRIAGVLPCVALCCALAACGSDESIQNVRDTGNPGIHTWTKEDLLDVWGSGPEDVWTVGTHGSVLHFDGSQWVALPSGVDQQLSGVSGTGPNDVWMVGAHSAALHWNGSMFQNTIGLAEDELLGVWSGAEGFVFASGISAGIAYLRHFDGTRWHEAVLNQAGSLWDIWGNSVNDVWTVGTARNNQGFLLHFEGQAWNFSKYEGAPLRSVWGTGPNDVWCVAYDGPIQHWNGTSWRVYDENLRLFGVWGSSETDVWAIGTEGALVHYDGSTWVHASSGTRENLWGIWGSAQDDVWIVGGNGTILHYDGFSWTPSFRSG